MPRIHVLLLPLVLFIGGCQKYVPVNLPIDLQSSQDEESPTYQDELGRTIGAADADGPEYRLTLQDGTQFYMKNPRIRGDSVVGYYRPTKDSSWARVSVELFDMRIAEQKEVDWLSTISLLTVPITLALLFTL
ncbi:MAG: hypothetical protein M8861_03190 [marine benthic group bacterium]|nr:hypothetical protein [Gemmatimonadota bacterium]